MRVSVSAEVYGEHNKREDFQAPIFPKSEETMQNIMEKLNKSMLFGHLEKKEKRVLALAMKEINFSKDDFVIKEGEDGNNLFVVDNGELRCTKSNAKNGEEEFMIDYKSGDAFGELALLYNAPRAASIQASTDCNLYSLDRETFNNIVK